MLGWARCGSHKKHVGTCYDEHVFLHLEGYAGPVVRYGPCMTLNIDALFFIPWWAVADPIKSVLKYVMSNMCFCIRCDLLIMYCIWVRPRCESSMHYFGCSGGPGADATRSAPDMLR
jgi:hypothetical protein